MVCAVSIGDEQSEAHISRKGRAGHANIGMQNTRRHGRRRVNSGQI